MAYIDKDKILYYLDTSEEAPIEGRKIAFKSDIDKIPTADVVLTEVMEQIKWERDIAIEQLASYGVCLGEKKELVEVVRCKNCDVPHNKWTGCPHLNGLIPPPNHYCACGTPKERGGEK